MKSYDRSRVFPVEISWGANLSASSRAGRAPRLEFSFFLRPLLSSLSQILRICLIHPVILPTPSEILLDNNVFARRKAVSQRTPSPFLFNWGLTGV